MSIGERGLFVVLLLLLGFAGQAGAGMPADEAPNFERRIAAQVAIERVYHGHRLGDTESFERAVTRSLLDRRVRGYLRKTSMLERLWGRTIGRKELLDERLRIERDTRLPDRLQEIYAALGHDAEIIDEYFVRPILVDRLARHYFANDPYLHREARRRALDLRHRLVSGEIAPLDARPGRLVVEFTKGAKPAERRADSGERIQSFVLPEKAFARRRAESARALNRIGVVEESRDAFTVRVVLAAETRRIQVAIYRIAKIEWDAWESALDLETHNPLGGQLLPEEFEAVIEAAEAVETALGAACGGEAWSSVTETNAPEARETHTAVWTGNVMIVWGGVGSGYLNTGSRYDPLTDSWSPTSTAGAPTGRVFHTAVWTGQEMIVWGGYSGVTEGTGGRYDPVADAWAPTSTDGAATGRDSHSAVWTGSEMIVWGGYRPILVSLATGGRYDPVTDSWTPTTTVDAPTRRAHQTAVWTGQEMIVWGGTGGGFQNTGGRYDPQADSWSPTSTTLAASARDGHVAAWTGQEMIVWGGYDGLYLDTGGRYVPATDNWTATTTVDAPSARTPPSVVWTTSEMIVWGGFDGTYLDSGKRYRPATDSWAPMDDTSPPVARWNSTAVWTGDEMLIWGGSESDVLGSGSGYGLSVDNDADGFCTEVDCRDDDDQNWGVPTEVQALVFPDTENLAWSPPTDPGGVTVSYDALRADLPWDFVSGITCIASAQQSTTTASDTEVPPSGTTFFYLIRATSGCPDGQGGVGTDSLGNSRPAGDCPAP